MVAGGEKSTSNHWACFNVTAESLSGGGDKVAYFEGTPIPISVLPTGVLALDAWQDHLGAWALGPWVLHPLALLLYCPAR